MTVGWQSNVVVLRKNVAVKAGAVDIPFAVIIHTYEEIEDFPIILLDDFMSELDEKRIKGFIKNIKNNQVLITCTKRIEVKDMNCDFFEIIDAKIIK